MIADIFVIGSQAADNGHLLERIVLNGNELGNHAMHDEPSQSLTDEMLTPEILDVESLIHTAYLGARTDPPSRYFRPGSGFFNQRMLEILSRLKYRLILGSIYPHDPQISLRRLNARHILSMLRPGAIIICHDRRSWTPPMLRRVVPKIRRRGYRITTVTELLSATTSDP